MRDTTAIDGYVQNAINPSRDWVLDNFGTQEHDFESYRDNFVFGYEGYMWADAELHLLAAFLGRNIDVARQPSETTRFQPSFANNGDIVPVATTLPALQIFFHARHYVPATSPSYRYQHERDAVVQQQLFESRLFGASCEGASGSAAMCPSGENFRGGMPKRVPAAAGGGGGGGVGGEDDGTCDSDDEEGEYYDDEDDDSSCYGFCEECNSCDCVGHEPLPAPDQPPPVGGLTIAQYSEVHFSDAAAAACNVFKQGSKEWLQARLKRVTASKVGEIVGVSRYGTATTVVNEKLQELFKNVVPPPPTIHMKHGSLMEQPVFNFLKQNLLVKSKV
jgi:hypothetical protein